MTTGAPIYLVSACSSGEEFVAAFRRYADRTGLFIPCAEPLPAGRRGVFALTLKDGGVMVEGVAEIIASSPKPSALHGRIGMTVRFVEADGPSKTVLAELEKARLSMKPAPPSVPPRPAAIPAEPRPVVPAPGGRIDANNALAECVMIGDLAALGGKSDGPPKASQKFVVPAIPGPSDRPKSPTAPPEPRTTTTRGIEPPKSTTLGMSPLAKPTDKPADKPADKPNDKATTLGMQPIKELPAAVIVDKPPPATTLGMPQQGKEPAAAVIVDKKPPPATTLGMPQQGKEPAAAVILDKKPAEPTGTTLGMPAVDKNPARGAAAPITPVPTNTVPGVTAKADARIGRATVMGPAVAPAKAAETQIAASTPAREDSTIPAPAPPMVAPTAPKGNPSPRARSGTTPPRFPTPVAPMPIMKPPAAPAPPIVAEPVQPVHEVDLNEPTDLNAVPPPPGAAATPFDVPTVDSGKVLVEPATSTRPTDPPINTSSRASQILAAIPSGGDWTMTPDASAPTVLSAGGAKGATIPEPTPAPGPPPGPATGDWTISITDAGWGEPQKLEARAKQPAPAPMPPVHPKTGNPVMAVSSEKDLSTTAPEDRPTSIGPKVEIDPTLMEPLTPMPADDEEVAALAPPPAVAIPVQPMLPNAHVAMPMQPQMPGMPPAQPMMHGNVPPPLAPMPMPMHVAMDLGPQQPGPLPNSYVTPAQGQTPAPHPVAMTPFPAQRPAHRGVTDAGTGFFINDSAQVPRYPSEATYALDPAKSRKKFILIAAGVGGGLLVIIVLALLLGGGGDKKPSAGKGSAGKTTAIIKEPKGSDETRGSDDHIVTDDPNRVETPKPDAGAVASPPTSCSVEITSTPTGAEVALDNTKDKILGTTPGTYPLPCGEETKLYIRKAKYVQLVKPVTATAETAKVAVKLTRLMFAVKVTSTPAGATITVGGKSMGVTPTTIKLPAQDTATITISKDGYISDTQKVPVKSNNTPHHVSLKKGAKRGR